MKLTNTILSTGALVALGIGMAITTTTVHADSVTSTAHESIYHLTTKDGWSNDLQTIAWNSKGNYYDLYFLHSKTADDPNEAGDQNWYHTTTKDFVHFTPQNEAIKADGPEAPYTWTSAWTGTVLVNNGQIAGVPKGAQVAYFSGLEKHDGGSQNIWSAWSSDNGKTFSHILNGASPVIDHSWNFTSHNRVDERDPAVVYWHGKMLMYVAEGDEIGVYQSHVGNWSYTANGIHNDESANSAFTKHFGSYSVARNLELGNDMSIKSTPIVSQGKEFKHYNSVSKDHPINGINASSNRPFTNGRDTNGTIYNLLDVPSLSVNKLYNLHFYNTKSSYRGRIYIDIWQGNDYVRLNYDPSNGLYNVKTRSGELDRGRNGQAASSYYYDGLLGNGNGYIADSGVKNRHSIDLTVLTDKNSVEFFFPNGQSYTVARFNTSQKQDFKIFTEDPTNGNKVDITQANLSQN